jgi:hypothetical protein
VIFCEAVTAMATFSGAFMAWLAAALPLSCGLAAAQVRLPEQLARFGIADSNYAVGGATLAFGPDAAWTVPLDMPRLLARHALDTPPLPLAAYSYASAPSCMVPWLQCAAFGSLAARMREHHAFLNGKGAGDDAMAGRRNLVHVLSAGMRFDFPTTRTARHGPWFVQLSVSRRSPEFRTTLPRQRRIGVSLSIGTEF